MASNGDSDVVRKHWSTWVPPPQEAPTVPSPALPASDQVIPSPQAQQQECVDQAALLGVSGQILMVEQPAQVPNQVNQPEQPLALVVNQPAVIQGQQEAVSPTVGSAGMMVQIPAQQQAQVQTDGAPIYAANFNVLGIESVLLRIAVAMEKMVALSASRAAPTPPPQLTAPLTAAVAMPTPPSQHSAPISEPQPKQIVHHAAPRIIHEHVPASVAAPVNSLAPAAICKLKPTVVQQKVQIKAEVPDPSYDYNDGVIEVQDDEDVEVEPEDASRRCGICHVIIPIDEMFIIDPCGHYPYCNDCVETLGKTFAQLPAYLRMSGGTEKKVRCPYCQQTGMGSIKIVFCDS